jgi:hypothetical protein
MTTMQKAIDVFPADPLTETPKFMLDGETVNEARVRIHVISAFFNRSLTICGNLVVHAVDEDLSIALGSYTLEDIGNSIGVLSLGFHKESLKFIDRVYFIRHKVGDTETWGLAFSWTIWPEDWANPYTISEYENAVSALIEESNEFTDSVDLWNIELESDDDHDEDRSGTLWTFSFVTSVRSPKNFIADEIDYWTKRFQEVNETAVRRILKNRKDALVTFFDFPPFLQSACEQYLVYFIQFLEDLGIQADSELKREAGYLMFR